jgi:HEAT repeat protein
MGLDTLTEQEEIRSDICGNHTFYSDLHLMNDENPDVVLRTVQVLDHLKDPRALEALRSLLSHPDHSVVRAAIIAIGHLGDDRTVSDLVTFLDGEPWLRIAAIQALGNIRSPLSAAPLARLLKDPLTGPLAAEALARVGGTSALRSLAGHWIKFHRETDTEMFLGLLAHVIEGITRKSPKIAGLKEAILPRLDSPSAIVRTYAARCLLALGPGPGDKKAISIIAESVSESDSRILPACLKNRSDLIVRLLKKQGPEQIWGFQLVSLFPETVTTTVLADAIENYHNHEYLDCVANALLKIKTPSIVPVILGLYLRVPVSSRHLLNPAFRIYKKQLRNLLIDLDIDDETRLVISAHLGISPVCIALEIFDLPKESRILVISQITGCKAIIKAFPWIEWLENDPLGYASVAAEVAAHSSLRELMPALRKVLSFYPVPGIIKTAGELGDKESVPILTSYLDKTSSRFRTLIIESLGRIGGREAREVLRNAAGVTEAQEARIAYRTLAQCSAEEDGPFFRETAAHPDRHIRLACAEFLGCHPAPDNLLVLAELATDRDSLVSERALTFLKMRHKGIRGTCCSAEITSDREFVWNSAPVEDSVHMNAKTPRSTEIMCV